MTLQEYINSNCIDEKLSEKLIPLFKTVHYDAGQTILNMGENTNVIYIILEGIVRGYYLDPDGNDITKCFSHEGEWCCIYNFLQNTPSTYYVQALENCTLGQIDVQTFESLIEEYPVLQKIYNKLTREAFMQVEEKGASFQKLNAKERYLLFIEKHPDINRRVKQEYIASYLGITPSSLSRIKRGL